MEQLAPTLPPGVERMIGRFIANFALLEEYLRGFICEIPPSSAPAGEIITSQLSFRGLIVCFGALIKEYVSSQEIHREADGLLKQIEQINEFRNRLVHSMWLEDPNSRIYAVRQKHHATRKVGYAPKIESFKKSDLEQKCNEVASFTWQISDIYDKIKAEACSSKGLHS